MGYPNRCFGCHHYEGEAGGDNAVYCSLNGRKEIRNGIAGCGSFSADSTASCANCHYALGGPPGPICSKNITTMSKGFKFGYCHGFAKRDYYDDTASKKKSGCFITEATCNHLGFADDCDILMSLRQFRDQVLLTSPEWRGLVANYYDIAEEIVTKINASANKEMIYQTIAERFLPELAKNSITHDQHVKKITRYQDMIRFIEQTLADSKHD
jgi:hypothetical protein